MVWEWNQAYAKKMKIRISILTLLIGLTTSALAQPAPPREPPLAVPVIPVPGTNGQNQPVPSPNEPPASGSPDTVATNNINPADTNGSNGYHGNYGATNGNGGMTNGVYGSPYATYTNPYYTYANTNVLYTNPYYIYARTNRTYVNPNWSNANRDLPATNNPNAADLNLTNSNAVHLTSTNAVHHWWNW